MRIIKNYPLKKFTSMAVGGPARYFVPVKTEKELLEALKWAGTHKLRVYLAGEGSNLIPADRGFNGLVIANKISVFKRQGNLVTIGAGDNLLRLIFKLNRLGLGGMEKMAGIPGTVGGAIYGSAGAYGHEIQARAVKIRFFDGRKFRSINHKSGKFAYRGSIFKKHKNWIITQAQLKLRAGDSKELMKISRGIIKLRAKKYPPGMKCPGSFFKNIKIDELPASLRKKMLKKIDSTKIIYGKLPAGYLLEGVSAKGKRQGGIRVAGHHANLFYNAKNGTTADIVRLANSLKKLVKKKFSITIQEEVQYL